MPEHNFNNEIANRLLTKDLDFRKIKNASLFDQKCTPGVINLIATCIVNTITQNIVFSHRTIRECPTLLSALEEDDKQPAKREIDKLVSQPMRVFKYAGLVSQIGTETPYLYRVSEEQIQLLFDLSNSLSYCKDFLFQYTTKLISDSGLKEEFDKFLNLDHDLHLITDGNIRQQRIRELSERLDGLREFFKNYIFNETNIHKKYEPGRIFSKLLNIQSLKRHKYGIERGKLSDNIIANENLCYTNINFIDKLRHKPHNQTRKQFNLSTPPQSCSTNAINCAKETIRLNHVEPEIEENYLCGDNLVVHHIFPKGKKYYPKLAATLENLILLGYNQHNNEAHIHGTKINPEYQKKCLHAKLQSIITSPTLYSIDRFIKIIQEGYSTTSEPTNRLISSIDDWIDLAWSEYYRR